MEWIKTDEQLPDKDMPCLVVYKESRRDIDLLYFNVYYQVWDDEDGDDYKCDLSAVSHWMQLPEKP